MDSNGKDVRNLAEVIARLDETLKSQLPVKRTGKVEVKAFREKDEQFATRVSPLAFILYTLQSEVNSFCFVPNPQWCSRAHNMYLLIKGYIKLCSTLCSR